MNPIRRLSALPLLGWIFRGRFLKFGTVGASGVLVNLGMLYLGQEYLFIAVQPSEMRLNVSLALAIFCATINNFIWNRSWTWHDRKHHHDKHTFIQFGQYALACWLGIALQVVFTKILTAYFHYLIANLVAIALASIFNFIVNDFWTFGRRKHPAKHELCQRPPDLDRVLKKEAFPNENC